MRRGRPRLQRSHNADCAVFGRTLVLGWKYTKETLRDTLTQAVEHYGPPMTVAEFDWWRNASSNCQGRGQRRSAPAVPDALPKGLGHAANCSSPLRL
jgi:hypothetical protein